MLAYKKVQPAREKKSSVEEQAIVNGCSQQKVVLRVEVIILSILLNQIKIDRMTGKCEKSFGYEIGNRIEVTCR